MKIKSSHYGFTLIEILVGILIVSIVFIGGFQALSTILYGKSKLIQDTNIGKEAFHFNEKLFDMIKKWGTLDYEEYFNRSIVWTSYSSGFYDTATGYWNFGYAGNIGTTNYGDDLYHCISGVWNPISGTGWCVTSKNYISPANLDRNHDLQPQRYGQYKLQFIDYNSNYNNDLWDENADGNIRWDDDDEDLWIGPSVFAPGEKNKELYLISGDGKKRTFLRLHTIKDPDSGSNPCNRDINGNMTGSGCLGTIEYITLIGKDWWNDHQDATGDIDKTEYDGDIDTWIIDPLITGQNNIIAWGEDDNNQYWVPLFPKTIHIEDFYIEAYPNTYSQYGWKMNSADVGVAPYIRLYYWVLPSWKWRKIVKNKAQKLNFSTTISLTDIFSK